MSPELLLGEMGSDDPWPEKGAVEGSDVFWCAKKGCLSRS